jgi:hypothetical protein
LVYKLPSEPSRLRAAVWRKLKGAGAIYLQDGVAALPSAAGGSERALRSLAAEIREMGGTAHLLQATPLGGEEALITLFNAAREAEYHELLDRCRDFHAELERERAARNFTFAELEENEDDLTKLEAWRGKIRARDHFAVPLGAEADAALHSCREDLDAFARAVYATADHGAAREAEDAGQDGDGDEQDTSSHTDDHKDQSAHDAGDAAANENGVRRSRSEPERRGGRQARAGETGEE